MPRVVVPHPVLTTARLRLRAFRLEDVDAMHACYSDPQMMRFWDRPAHVRRSQSERAVRRGMAGVPARFRIWAVADAATDQCVGMVNYHKRDRANRSAHIGYMIHPAWHRQGLAREAVGALIGHCFGGRKDSSFCEQKEAKKLHPLAPASLVGVSCQRIKVFWFFFSKKNCFLACLQSKSVGSPGLW
jgi:hypothetical protein